MTFTIETMVNLVLQNIRHILTEDQNVPQIHLALRSFTQIMYYVVFFLMEKVQWFFDSFLLLCPLIPDILQEPLFVIFSYTELLHSYLITLLMS